MAISVSMDSKGRISIPKAVREQLHLEPGDVFFLDVAENKPEIRVAKAQVPFDNIADFARWALENGQTQSLQDVAAELGVTLDDERSVPD
jgi:AbrB family looped-hinge helix DNA binding protein